MRSRIYEIKLQPPDVLSADEIPTVTVYADRSVELYPEGLAENWESPTRHEAADTLMLARGFGYVIERRFI
jgi:hypothetical protein